MLGSKWVDYWTSGAVYECSESAGSPQGSPPAADYVGCEARRRTYSERETGTEELCEIKWEYHIVGTTAGLVTVQDEACPRQGHNDPSRRRIPVEAYFGSLPSRRTQRPPPSTRTVCTVPVYKPLCIPNKPVLSQPLSLLHVHTVSFLAFTNNFDLCICLV
jgi:hypothetical protein